MNELQNPVQTIPAKNRLLIAQDFLRLSDVPTEAEWFANLTSPATRRAYQIAIKNFMQFTGWKTASKFCQFYTKRALKFSK